MPRTPMASTAGGTAEETEIRGGPSVSAVHIVSSSCFQLSYSKTSHSLHLFVHKLRIRCPHHATSSPPRWPVSYPCNEYTADSCDGGADGYSCPRIQQFSSATTPYEGIPTGTNGGPGTIGKVDAAGHINSVADAISGFYAGTCTPNGDACDNHGDCCSVYCNAQGSCRRAPDGGPPGPTNPTPNPPTVPGPPPTNPTPTPPTGPPPPTPTPPTGTPLMDSMA